MGTPAAVRLALAVGFSGVTVYAAGVALKGLFGAAKSEEVRYYVCVWLCVVAVVVWLLGGGRKEAWREERRRKGRVVMVFYRVRRGHRT